MYTAKMISPQLRRKNTSKQKKKKGGDEEGEASIDIRPVKHTEEEEEEAGVVPRL